MSDGTQLNWDAQALKVNLSPIHVVGEEIQTPGEKKAARRGLLCGLAEEETRLVANSLREISELNDLTQRVSLVLLCIKTIANRKPLQSIARFRFRFLESGRDDPALWGCLQPQDLCCPQTACGQHRPWEPTALHEIDQATFRPPIAANTTATLSLERRWCQTESFLKIGELPAKRAVLRASVD
jgi:hypothetical protein